MIVPMAVSTAGALVAALLAVNVVVWVRTAGLRAGRLEMGPARSGYSPTCRATWLAGLAGVAVGAVGIGLLVESRAWLGMAVAGAGVFVAVAGLTARVSGLDITRSGLTVHYAARHACTMSWSDVLHVRPPGTPLGGWGVGGPGASTTLMPSDVLGLEWMLRATVMRAGLHYEDGTWQRRAAVSPTG